MRIRPWLKLITAVLLWAFAAAIWVSTVARAWAAAISRHALLRPVVIVFLASLTGLAVFVWWKVAPWMLRDLSKLWARTRRHQVLPIWLQLEGAEEFYRRRKGRP